jgi:hypothetical protein
LQTRDHGAFDGRPVLQATGHRESGEQRTVIDRHCPKRRPHQGQAIDGPTTFLSTKVASGLYRNERHEHDADAYRSKENQGASCLCWLYSDHVKTG